jgi:drug/metabolite transporter (DMT)-like permease
MHGAHDKEASLVMSRLSAFAPLMLVVAGSLVYHVAAKSVPKALDPVASVIGVYAAALVASIAVYVAARPGSMPAITHLSHPAVAAVGLGALMIELGFLITYRAAWPVSTASVMTNGLVAVLLVPIGALMFSEAITLVRVIGVALCLIGVSLLQR